jgi:ATP-dependent helicase/nuclease subunit B
LRRHRLYDVAGRLVRACELLSAGRCRPFEGVHWLFVDGFTDFSRTQHDVLAGLAGWAEQVWVTLPDEEGGDRAELFSRARATFAALGRLAPRIERVGGAAVTYPSHSAGRNGSANHDAPPQGLVHLERELFRPLKAVSRAEDAAGLLLIEAPGAVGEARMVARQIRLLLDGGARPDDVLVVVRDLAPYADLVREVFDDYGIALDVEGAVPLVRNPAVATLLRCLRLPEEGWPFAAVTALLRSGYFRPGWPEAQGDAEMPRQAEALLRLLGRRRALGRERPAAAGGRAG